MNEIVKNVIGRCDINSEEINKLYESIVDLRRQTIDERRPEGSATDSLVKALTMKVEDLDFALKFLRTQFDENIRGIEDGGDQTTSNENQGMNLKDLIRSLKGELKGMTERVDKVTLKQDSLSSDILHKLKKDLVVESARILDEFRTDLRNSIGKIDEQLQNKVDHIILDEFGKKMDVRMNNEISKKIDKNDLKKNNTFISKKVRK